MQPSHFRRQYVIRPGNARGHVLGTLALLGPETITPQPIRSDRSLAFMVLAAEQPGEITVMSAIESVAGKQPDPGDAPTEETRQIWRLQYGPCWCRGTPADSASFDFVRTSTMGTGEHVLDFNLLILSDRVVDGWRAVYLQFESLAPEPRRVVATASCPAASRFWDQLPVAWSPLDEVVPVDVRVEECIIGRPEALMVAVLELIASEGSGGRRHVSDQRTSPHGSVAATRSQ